jgi:hypothetical protein
LIHVMGKAAQAAQSECTSARFAMTRRPTPISIAFVAVGVLLLSVGAAVLIAWFEAGSGEPGWRGLPPVVKTVDLD